MNDEPSFPISNPPGAAKRTFEVYVLLGILLVTSWLGGLRAVQGIRYWQLLNGSLPGPLYVVFTGVVYGFSALASAVGIFWRKPWGAWLARLLAIGLGTGYWLDWLGFTRSAARRGSWPFELGVTLILVLFTLATLASPAQKRYFQEN